MGLTSVRRPNGPYGFPVSRFHNGVSATGQGRNQWDQADKTVILLYTLSTSEWTFRSPAGLIQCRSLLGP